jgi:photosystem II stability/assembly factor-like uncharacterized protein
MADPTQVVSNDLSRVFLQEGGSRPDHEAVYQACGRAGPFSQALGDLTPIYCPDPTRYRQFIEKGIIQAQPERATVQIIGRYALDVLSDLLRLSKKRCENTLHVNFGTCDDPTDLNSFKKTLIFERAVPTNVGLGDLGSFGDVAEVDETVDFSLFNFYEFGNMSYAKRAEAIVTNEVVDVALCDRAACGDCDDESTGCEKVYAVTLAAGGSPGTPPDVVFSVTNGDAGTWLAHDIDTMTSADNPDAVDCVGVYLVVISGDTNSLHYVLLTDLNATTDPAFTEVATGFVAGGEPRDIFSLGKFAYIAGDSGYIYYTSDPTSGVTLLDAGTATASNFAAIYAVSEDFAVAVGDSAGIVTITNKSSVSVVTPPVGVGVSFTSVLAKSTKEWFIGANNGNVYWTKDGGLNFSALTFTNAGAGVVRDIVMSSDSILYMSRDTATPLGQILESRDGGESWVVAPRPDVGSVPAGDRFNRLAACPENPNWLVAVGLADDASDGLIVKGEVL